MTELNATQMTAAAMTGDPSQMALAWAEATMRARVWAKRVEALEAALRPFAEIYEALARIDPDTPARFVLDPKDLARAHAAINGGEL